MKSVKSVTHRVMLFTALTTLGGATLAHAQVTDPVEFTTTFPFTVGNTSMPAGSYEIRRDTDSGTVYRIDAPKKHIGTLFEVEPTTMNTTPQKSEVVFKRYGQGYVLKSIWEAGSSDGVQTVTTEAERHHAKNGGAVTEQRLATKKAAKAGTD